MTLWFNWTKVEPNGYLFGSKKWQQNILFISIKGDVWLLILHMQIIAFYNINLHLKYFLIVATEYHSKIAIFSVRKAKVKLLVISFLQRMLHNLSKSNLFICLTHRTFETLTVIVIIKSFNPTISCFDREITSYAFRRK